MDMFAPPGRDYKWCTKGKHYASADGNWNNRCCPDCRKEWYKGYRQWPEVKGKKRKQDKKYYNRPEVNKRKKEYHKKHKGKPHNIYRVWRNSMRRNYNLTAKEWYTLYLLQGKACAICDKPLTRLYAYVDHDHNTREVRGLLCPGCNTAMGYIDIPGWVEKAMAYKGS